MEYFFLGLGNPEGYEGTRHNIGKDFVAGLVSHADRPWELIGRCRIACVPLWRHTVTCAVSDGFMNETGNDARDILAELEPSKLVVIHDDTDFPVGTVRLSRKKSSGGHNGVESVIRTVGTDDFWRLRIGIGRGGSDGAGNTDGGAGKRDTVRDHVLAVLPPDDMRAITEGLRSALPDILTGLLCGDA